MRYECPECESIIDEGDAAEDDQDHYVCPDCGTPLKVLDASEYGN